MSGQNSRGVDSNSPAMKAGLRGVEIVAVIGAAFFFLLAVGMYVKTFGMAVTDSHEKWGQFGDFVGGMLNPLYALLAFLAVLLSLSEQRKGERRAQLEFQEQKSQVREASFKEDVYRIVREIDSDIDSILEIKVAEFLTIHHMAYEAQRQRSIMPKVESYAEFINLSKDQTTVVGIYYARLKTLIVELHRNLKLYNGPSESYPNPVVGYFARKNAGLMQMFDDIGGVPQDVVVFFKHHQM